MKTYYCSENGMRGIIIIEARNETEAIQKYTDRTGRKPDMVNEQKSWGDEINEQHSKHPG